VTRWADSRKDVARRVGSFMLGEQAFSANEESSAQLRAMLASPTSSVGSAGCHHLASTSHPHDELLRTVFVVREA
jgi:hypothetical protein